MSKEGDNLGAADHNDQWSEFFSGHKLGDNSERKNSSQS